MKCPICDKTVKNARGISMHMSSTHKKEWATGNYSCERTRQRYQAKASRLISKWSAEDAENPTVVPGLPKADTHVPHPEAPETVVNRTLLSVIQLLLKGYQL